jgi:hypothetical protein
MWLITILPMAVAFGAALLAWRHATRIDRTSLNGADRSAPGDDQGSWGLALGAVVAAIAATMTLQLVLLSRL